MGNTTASLTHEQLFGGGATIEKTGLGIKLATLSIAICMTLTGCGQTTAGSSSTGGTTSNEKSYSARQEDTQVLEDAAKAALDEKTAMEVSSIEAFENKGEYSMTIRVVAAGGYYMPDVAEQTAQAFFDKAQELGLNATQYVVTEYSESSTGAKENMLAWSSDDGVTGIYSDDSGAEPVVKIGVSLNALRELVGNIKEPENSEEIIALSADYQGEWERVGHEKYERIVVNENTVNTVLFETSKDWRKEKTVTHIFTLYFGLDEEKGLVVTNQYKQVIQTVSMNEQGEIELYDKSRDETETYRKVLLFRRWDRCWQTEMTQQVTKASCGDPQSVVAARRQTLRLDHKSPKSRPRSRARGVLRLNAGESTPKSYRQIASKLKSACGRRPTGR